MTGTAERRSVDLLVSTEWRPQCADGFCNHSSGICISPLSIARKGQRLEVMDWWIWDIQWLFPLKATYDSVVTLAFAFVTLTPNCLAFATISTLFLDDTACEILFAVNTFGVKTGTGPALGG